MSFESEVQARAAAIDAQAQALENCADPASRAAFQDLLGSVMDLHREGLQRMFAVLAEKADANRAVLERFAGDPVIHTVLMLHDLHPFDVITRVERALDQLRPALERKHATAKLMSIEDATVSVLLEGEGVALNSLRSHVEQALIDAAPDARIVVETAAQWNASFVSIDALNPAADLLRIRPSQSQGLSAAAPAAQPAGVSNE